MCVGKCAVFLTISPQHNKTNIFVPVERNRERLKSILECQSIRSRWQVSNVNMTLDYLAWQSVTLLFINYEGLRCVPLISI